VSEHRWSGWPGAWCLDCGKEDALEIDLAGPGAHHRYSPWPHTAQPCEGCSSEPCLEPGSHRNDPYWHAEHPEWTRFRETTPEIEAVMRDVDERGFENVGEPEP